jgi:hypothetical protein
MGTGEGYLGGVSYGTFERASPSTSEKDWSVTGSCRLKRLHRIEYEEITERDIVVYNGTAFV